MKKTLVLVTVVIGFHCAVILLLSGCKTTRNRGVTEATTAPMPPLTAPTVAPPKIKPSPVVNATKYKGTIEYTVKKGDSVSLIAKRHNVGKTELTELNKLADPNKIRIGQKLIIPKHAHSTIKARKANAKPKTGKSEPTASLATDIDGYVIQAGDCLSKIASKFNVKISELREVNKLTSDKIRLGQKLIIPGAKKDVTPIPIAPETAPAGQEAAPAATIPPPDASTVATPVTAVVQGLGITHVVLPDEDLSSIAKLYAVTIDDIVAANQMGTNRSVQAGQKITIP